MSAPAAAPAPPGLDVLSGRPDDPHTRAARATVAALARRFPRAGLAVAGSVARGTHRPGSDLDLLVVDAGFRRDVQVAGRHEGVHVAVVCLRAGDAPGRARRWMLGDAAVVAMVRTATVVRDPDGVIAALRQEVARIDQARLAEARALLDELHARAADLARRAGEPSAPGAALLTRLLGVLVDAWYLARGRTCDSKETYEQTFRAMAETDPGIYAVIRTALPVTASSAEPLLRAAEMILGAELRKE